MNLGQLALLLRGRFLVDAVGFNQVRGLPFTAPADARRDQRDAGGGVMTEIPLKARFQVRPGGSGGARVVATARSSRRCSPSCPSSARKPGDIVFVSGSAARRDSPYYLSTYGLHSIHGRAPA